MRPSLLKGGGLFKLKRWTKPMKTSEILDLDFRKQESKEIINKALCKVKPLAKYLDGERVPLEAIEKVLGVMIRKYNITIMYITPTYIPTNKENLYSISFRERVGTKWLGNVYGCCIYEVMAKSVIKVYSMIKNNEVQKVGD